MLPVGLRRALALTGFLIAVAGAAAPDEVRPIRIGVEVNSPPLSSAIADGVPVGFTPELLREMQATGLVKFEIVPGYWSPILRKFNDGRLDALANVIITDERRATMEYSIAHASLHGVSYTRPDDPPITHTNQFAGKTMASLKGSMSNLNAVNHQGWGAKIIEHDTWLAVLQAVKSGQCDFALLTRSLSFEQPDELGLHREFVQDIIHPIHIVVHPGDQDRLEAINEALAIMRENGTFDRLFAQWIGPIEPHPIRLNDLRPYLLPSAIVLGLVLALICWQRWNNQRLRAQARVLYDARTMLDHAGRIAKVGGWELDLASQQVSWTDETCRLHGVEPGAKVAIDDALDFYVLESRSTIQAAVQACIEHGTPWDIESELIDRQGRRFWVRLQGKAEKVDGKVVKLSGAFHDIDEHKRNTFVQEFLAHTSGGSRDKPFFEELADFLGRHLQVDYIWVDRLLGDQLNAQTVAVWCDGRIEDNLTYALADTPYGKLARQNICCFPSGVCQLFPDDQTLQDLRAESYLGVTLFGHQGQPIGLIAAISRKPKAITPQIETTLKLVAVRAAGELEQMIAEENLREVLCEKEALLKEVHHRVKNNLQVITSLLRLESAKQEDPVTKMALRDMRGRIRSMALLHETLYRSGDFARVDLGEYLCNLSTQLFRGQNIASHLVRLDFALSPVKVDLDQAISCGLIVNELLTNALKYGFPEGRTGMVHVGVAQSTDGEVQLQVSDDGVGLPADLDISRTHSLGLRLVSDLTRQLQGTLTIQPGSRFDITFMPHHNYSHPPLPKSKG